jgi:hypothetical protein
MLHPIKIRQNPKLSEIIPAGKGGHAVKNICIVTGANRNLGNTVVRALESSD